MTKFAIYASEKVYYTKIVEAVDMESLLEMLQNEEIEFTNSDIVDGENFKIDSDIDVLEQ